MLKIKAKIGKEEKEYEVLTDPVPHIIVDSKKKLHGWPKAYMPRGERECTAERMLINPYNGCSNACCFCYASAIGTGYFNLYKDRKIMTVFKDYDKRAGEQLDTLSIASCGYLSAVTDPFQKANEKYKLSEKIIAEFNKRGLPIEIITKSRIPEEAIELLKGNKHNFAQATILTPHESIRQKIIPYAGDTKTLNENVERLVRAGISTVIRIDPIIPWITDREADLELMIKKYAGMGAKHIITSVLDVPMMLKQKIKKQFSGCELHFEYFFGQNSFPEKIFNDLNKSIDYRKKIFGFMREQCDKAGITLALCMEFEITKEKINEKPALKGLNKEFMSSNNCEGIDTPMHRKINGKFQPVENCDGNCLKCRKNPAPCGTKELQTAGKWDIADYRRWSKCLDS